MTCVKNDGEPVTFHSTSYDRPRLRGNNKRVSDNPLISHSDCRILRMYRDIMKGCQFITKEKLRSQFLMKSVFCSTSSAVSWHELTKIVIDKTKFRLSIIPSILQRYSACAQLSSSHGPASFLAFRFHVSQNEQPSWRVVEYLPRVVLLLSRVVSVCSIQ